MTNALNGHTCDPGGSGQTENRATQGSGTPVKNSDNNVEIFWGKIAATNLQMG